MAQSFQRVKILDYLNFGYSNFTMEMPYSILGLLNIAYDQMTELMIKDQPGEIYLSERRKVFKRFGRLVKSELGEIEKEFGSKAVDDIKWELFHYNRQYAPYGEAVLLEVYFRPEGMVIDNFPDSKCTRRRSGGCSGLNCYSNKDGRAFQTAKNMGWVFPPPEAVAQLVL